MRMAIPGGRDLALIFNPRAEIWPAALPSSKATTRPSVWEIPICRAAGEAPVNHGANAEARAQLYDVWRAMCDNTTAGSMPPPPP